MARDVGRFFPIPLVGTVVVLLALILLTPNLITSGGSPPAGSLETQAELIVDRVTGNATTHFYIHGLGLVRYQSITVALGTNTTWPAPSSPSAIRWSSSNWSNDSLAVVTATTADPVAINITALYVDSMGARIWFLGVFVFHVSGDTLYVAALLTGAASIPPTPVASLPLPIILLSSATGNPP
jgi:hypothetical protein